jgi:hypothetical protein
MRSPPSSRANRHEAQYRSDGRRLPAASSASYPEELATLTAQAMSKPHDQIAHGEHEAHVEAQLRVDAGGVLLRVRRKALRCAGTR